MANLSRSIKLFLGSWPNRIFLGLVLLFIIETVYLATTSSYPMAYDEAYHFNLIRFYSQHLNPFVSYQDASTYSLGNIVDNPSWLYHYLLSFPYRLLQLFGSFRIEVGGLRVISILFGVLSLLMLRHIAEQLSRSRWVALVVVSFFALTPTVTVLAAQINYDSLVILASLTTVGLLISLIRSAERNVLIFSLLILMISIGSLSKFSFLPIALGAFVLAFSVIVVRVIRGRETYLGSLMSELRSSRLVLLVGMVALLFFGLFAFSYGKNLVVYKTPVPDCAQVLDASACSAWGPWERNQALALQKQADPAIHGMDIRQFFIYWSESMWLQLFGSLAPNGVSKPVDAVLIKAMLVLSALGACMLILTALRLFKQYPQLLVVAGLSIFYLLVLFYRNYSENIRYGTPVAVQGRYLIPILGLVYLVLIFAAYTWFANKSRLHIRAQYMLTALGLAIFVVWGGGIDYANTILPRYKWKYDSPTQNVLVFEASLRTKHNPANN